MVVFLYRGMQSMKVNVQWGNTLVAVVVSVVTQKA